MTVKRRIDISAAVDRDVYVVRLVEYDTDTKEQRYLSNDGWREFAAYQVLGDLPTITGIEQLKGASVFADEVRALLGDLED